MAGRTPRVAGDGLTIRDSVTQVVFAIPRTSVEGLTYARFRVSSTPVLTPTGPAADGEVEDYAVRLVRPSTVYVDDDWALRLLPRPRPEGAAVRVALTERASAVVDGRRWVHEAVVWLYHEANTDLNVSLPEGARVLGVTVDGLAVTPLQASGSYSRCWTIPPSRKSGSTRPTKSTWPGTASRS